MAGNMGNDKRSAQSLQILKIDPQDGLIYIRGCIPGNDGGFLRIKDAVLKVERKRCFPPWATVPYPTFMGDIKELPLEMFPKLPETKEELERDPMLSVVGEKD